MPWLDDGVDAAGVVTQVRDGVAALQRLCERSSIDADRAGWLALVEECQAVMNTVTAAQDQAIVRAVCIDADIDDHGADIEYHRGLGHVSLDGPDLVGIRLCVARAFAVGRVEAAVRLAAGRRPQYTDDTPGPVEPGAREVEPGQPSGLGRLAGAMAEGRLDGYRAARVAAELVDAPADVANAVVAELETKLDSATAAQLARTARTVLNRIAPDLVRERAERARKARSLRRWPGEPGVDTWMGSFPAEQAMSAWAAVDALAHEYLADGHPGGIEAARADALIDLVTGSATVTVNLALTVPNDALHPDAGQDTGDRGDGDTTNSGHSDGGSGPGDGSGGPDHGGGRGPDDRDGNSDASGCSSLTDSAAATSTAREPSHEAGAASESVRGRGHRAEPCETSATGGSRDTPDAAGESVAPPAAWGGGRSFWRTQAEMTQSPGTPDVLVEVMAPGRSEPFLASRAWLTGNPAVRFRTAVAGCDRGTGGLSDLAGRLDSDAYRPSAELTRLVKDRDGRCRFPGCTISVRYCDLDHVRPWPTGPTSAANLLCLCRRHHRVKQAPGWRVRLRPGAIATWTDPTGRDHMTYPVDRLTPLVLAHPDSNAGTNHGSLPETWGGRSAAGVARVPSVACRDRFSVLEYVLEHQVNTQVKRHGRGNSSRYCWYVDQDGQLLLHYPCNGRKPPPIIHIPLREPTPETPPF